MQQKDFIYPKEQFLITRKELITNQEKMGLEEIRRIKNNGGKLPEKKIYYLPKVSKKRAALLAQKETNGDEQLEKWFDKIAKRIAKNPKCGECGEFISKEHYRHATAHLLPKKKDGGFPSVATHPLNYFILGVTCGCHYKTHRWDQMQKLKCFSVILERLIMIEPDVAQSERKNLPQFLLDAVAQNNFLTDKISPKDGAHTNADFAAKND